MVAILHSHSFELMGARQMCKKGGEIVCQLPFAHTPHRAVSPYPELTFTVVVVQHFHTPSFPVMITIINDLYIT